MDNRPLKFDEFENKMKMVVSVSATPGEYDIEKSCDTSPLPQIQPSPLPPLPEGEGGSNVHIPLRPSGEVR
jgi:hypothetical protein